MFARSPIPAFNASKVGLDDFLCNVFGVTALPPCTLCPTLLSFGDPALQPRPQLRHGTEQDQDSDKSTCLTVSVPAATATRESSISVQNIVSSGAFGEDFLNCQELFELHVLLLA